MNTIHPNRLEILLIIKIGEELRNHFEIIYNICFFLFLLQLFNTWAEATFIYIY